MKKLNGGSGLNRAFADVVITWYRTGLDQPLAREDARRWWAESLPSALRQRLFRRDPGEQSELFEQAAVWACEPVIGRELYEQALVAKEGGGYVAHDYVVDQIVRNPQRSTVPDAVWEHALQRAASNPDLGQRPGRVWAVGGAAYQEHALPHVLTAMQILAQAGDVNAWVNVGTLLAELGRLEDAARMCDQVVDRFDDRRMVPELRASVAAAQVYKGITFAELGRPEEAIGAYDQVVDRFGDATEPKLRAQVAKALVRKGGSLGELGRLEEEISAYDQVVGRFGDATEPELRQLVATALIYKGEILGELGRPEEAAGSMTRWWDASARPPSPRCVTWWPLH